MTIAESQKAVDAWIQKYGVRYFDEMTNTALLTEETGEIARLMARIYGEQSFKKHIEIPTAKQMLAEEMADLLFVLICIANQTGINLTDAFEKNLLKKTNRDKNRHCKNNKLR